VAALAKAIERAGTPLCALNTIDPNEQGGLAVIHVYSFSGSERCDRASTSGRGVLYLLDYAWPDDANYFLSFAQGSSRFTAGWDLGKIAVAVGDGTATSTQRLVAQALGAQATQVFP
jgi:hypothetical protein